MFAHYIDKYMVITTSNGYSVYALEDIPAGDQLYAFYGSEFFGENCPCDTCWVRETSIARQPRQEPVVNEEERAEAICNRKRAKREIEAWNHAS
jgi:hypothetical protein